MYKKRSNKPNTTCRKIKIFFSLIVLSGLSGCSRGNEKNDAIQLFNHPSTLSIETEEESTSYVSDKAEDDSISGAPYQYLTEHYGQPSANLGFIKDNSYANPILGLGCTLDDNWILYSYDEIADLYDSASNAIDDESITSGTNANMYDLVAESVDGLSNINITVEDGLISPGLLERDIAEEIMDYVEPILSHIGYTDIESEIISLDFANENHSAIYSTAEINSIPYYQCQVIYLNTVGKLATITVSSTFTDNTLNILDLFYSVYGIDNMFRQENDSAEKVTVSTEEDIVQADTETGKINYKISALPATVSLPERYHVYSLDNQFTEKMCQSQGFTVEQMTQYLNLSSVDMIAVPAGESFLGCSFEMDAKIKSSHDYGIDNLKNLSNEEFDLWANILIISFGTSDYEVLETDQVKYVIFDCKLMTPERRYATIINGNMIYFIGHAGEGLEMTEENYLDLEEFATSLKLEDENNK